MYDMTGFDYDIRDVIQVLNLRIRHKNARSYDVDCPFCGYKTGKMNVNIEKNVFRCNYCNEQGGMLDLYAKLYNLTKSEANKQIREALNLGQYRDTYRVPEKKKEVPVIKNSERASAAAIDHTYAQMLSLLTLSDVHRDALLERGLTIEQIEAQQYRSVPVFGMKQLARCLLERGCIVEGVPGFYLDKDRNWTVNLNAKKSGILIPVRSIEGRIQGFQIRLDHVTDSRKYIWLSSVNYEMGTSSGSPVHIIGDPDAKEIYVTEGALKGTIAHYLSGSTFVCAAGVTQYRGLEPVLADFMKRNLRKVYEAFDMDKKMHISCGRDSGHCAMCTASGTPAVCPFHQRKRETIQSGCNHVYEFCRSFSIPFQRLLWDVDGNGEWAGNIKGIDDYYYSIKKEGRLGAG